MGGLDIITELVYACLLYTSEREVYVKKDENGELTGMLYHMGSDPVLFMLLNIDGTLAKRMLKHSLGIYSSFGLTSAGDVSNELEIEKEPKGFKLYLSLIHIFIILPTGVVSLMKLFTDSVFWLNFAEGAFRILLFVLYVWAISFMGEIKRAVSYTHLNPIGCSRFRNSMEIC